MNGCWESRNCNTRRRLICSLNNKPNCRSSYFNCATNRSLVWSLVSSNSMKIGMHTWTQRLLLREVHMWSQTFRSWIWVWSISLISSSLLNSHWTCLRLRLILNRHCRNNRRRKYRRLLWSQRGRRWLGKMMTRMMIHLLNSHLVGSRSRLRFGQHPNTWFRELSLVNRLWLRSANKSGSL